MGLDMYLECTISHPSKTILGAEFPFEILNVTIEVCYWRNQFELSSWFRDLLKVEQCQETAVTRDTLFALVRHCRELFEGRRIGNRKMTRDESVIYRCTWDRIEYALNSLPVDSKFTYREC